MTYSIVPIEQKGVPGIAIFFDDHAADEALKKDLYSGIVEAEFQFTTRSGKRVTSNGLGQTRRE